MIVNAHAMGCTFHLTCTGIELCDAVNEIMKVPHQNLHSLGSNLELDEDRLQDVLTHYSLEERHQRLMELWFKKESDPSWEKLSEALQSNVLLSAKSNPEDSNQQQLSTSMDGISVTLSSPSSKYINLRACVHVY